MPFVLHYVSFTASLILSCSQTFAAESPAAPPPAISPTSTNLLVGVWKENRNNTRIELRSDGNYEWWIPYTQSDLAAKTLLHSGKWSVQNRALVLVPDKVVMRFPPPGIDVQYDLKLVSPEKVLLFSSRDHQEMIWTRPSKYDEPFWIRAVSYKPPFEMYSSFEPTNNVPFPGDWELGATGANRNAKVVFHLGKIEEIIQPESPPKPILTVSALKDFMDSHLKSAPDASNVLTSVIRIDDRDALMGISTIPHKGVDAPEWQCAVSFFWQTSAVWQNSILCSITLTAQKKDTLDILKDSLKSVKLLPETDKH